MVGFAACNHLEPYFERFAEVFFRVDSKHIRFESLFDVIDEIQMSQAHFSGHFRHEWQINVTSVVEFGIFQIELLERHQT